MSDVLSRALPAPRRWQDLESLAFDVYSRIWKTTDAELNGRGGQAQAGVDVYGTNRVENLYTGVQCKGKDADYGGALTEAELRAEVKKALTFQPPLDAFIVLTTAPNDVAIQRVAREISLEHRKKGLFEVRVTGWETFRHQVADYQDVMLKHFRDFAPVDVAEQISAAAQQHSHGLASLQKVVTVQGRMLADALDKQSGTDQLATRVDEITRLVGEGSPKAVLKTLDRILTEEGDTASSLAMYKIYTTKGNAHFTLGHEQEAIAFYRKGYEAYPEFINARVTLAIALLLEGSRLEAFEIAGKAIDEDPSSVRTVGTYIDAAPADTPIADLLAKIPQNLQDNADLKLRLATRAGLLGELDLQRKLSEEVLMELPDDWRALAGMAEALLQRFSKVDGMELTYALPPEYREDVERAADLMTRAWSILIQYDSSHQGRHVAANLINLLGALGREEALDGIFEQAFAAHPTYPPLLSRAAQRSATSGEWANVARLLDSCDEDSLTFDDVLLRLHAAISLGDAGKAAALCDKLETIAQTTPSLEESQQLLQALRVKVAIIAGEDQTKAISEALDVSPHSVVLRSVLSDDLDPEHPLHGRLTSEIGMLSDGKLSLRERVLAGETLFAAGAYSLAADLYEPIQGQGNGLAFRRRLQSLFLADRRAEARKLFETLPKEKRVSQAYLPIGVDIYQRAGLLKPALELFEKALPTNDVLRNRLGWIHLLARLGRDNDFIPWLKQVDEEIDGSADDLMNLARTIDHYLARDHRALSIGYRALRAGYSQPHIHLGFAVGLILNSSPNKQAMEGSSVVEPGNGIVLRNSASGELIYRVLETLPNPAIERGELGCEEPLAKRPLGCRIGDSIEFPKAGSDPQTFVIAEIQSRFVFALQRTTREFNQLFPDNSAFGTIEIDDSKGHAKFEPMLAMARNRARYCDDILEMYRDGPMPLSMVAKFSGTNVFEMWEVFSRDPAYGLKTAFGLAEEFRSAHEASRQGIILVDPVSLYAWTSLGIASLLTNIGLRLATVQSTIDIFRTLAEEREGQRGRKMGSFGWNGSQYTLTHLTDEVIDHQIEIARAALSLAESLILLPAESNHQLPEGVIELLRDVHPAFQDTLVAANWPNRSILTDDLGFRAICQEAGAKCTWTQPLAQVGLSANRLTHPNYRNILAALIDANYRFTQFGPHEILAELREADWSINDRLSRFAQLLTSESLDRVVTGRLLAHLLLLARAQAPGDKGLTVFYTAYLEAARDVGRADQALADFERALLEFGNFRVRDISRVILRPRLLASTYVSSPWDLTKDAREIAKQEMAAVRNSLKNGGLMLET